MSNFFESREGHQMSFDLPADVDQRIAQGVTELKSQWFGVMEGAAAQRNLEREVKSYSNSHRTVSQGSNRRPFSFSYFSVESLLILLCLTASLLILPVILPPLPPPPFMLLLVPVGILVVLLVLAFMPSDVRDIASSYV